MCRVLVIWPPKVEYVFSIQKHYTNFGETVAYLDAQDGIEVDVMDGSALLYFQWDFIQAYSKEYDHLVIYTDLHNSISAMKAAQLCKKISPMTNTISFGQGTPYIPNIYLQNGFDAAITDPMYQKSILNYILYTRGERQKQDLRGIVFREKDNIVEISDTYRLDVADVAFPALHKIPVAQYKRISGRDQLCFTVARGCPYPCRFCRVPVDQGRMVSYRPVADVVDYVEAAQADFASVKFIAATFTLNRDWVLELCSAIRQRQVKFKWIVTTRLDLLDEELIASMSQAGCIAVAFGLETLHTETQKRVDKHFPLDLVVRQVNLLHKYRIIPKAFIMLGIPGQSREEIEETYSFLRTHKVEVRPKEYYPYEQLIDGPDKMSLLRRFERDDVYGSPIAGVSALQFVEWLSDRTSVR